LHLMSFDYEKCLLKQEFPEQKILLKTLKVTLK